MLNTNQKMKSKVVVWQTIICLVESSPSPTILTPLRCSLFSNKKPSATTSTCQLLSVYRSFLCSVVQRILPRQWWRKIMFFLNPNTFHPLRIFLYIVFALEPYPANGGFNESAHRSDGSLCTIFHVHFHHRFEKKTMFCISPPQPCFTEKLISLRTEPKYFFHYFILNYVLFFPNSILIRALN